MSGYRSHLSIKPTYTHSLLFSLISLCHSTAEAQFSETKNVLITFSILFFSSKVFNASRNIIDRFPEIQFTHLSVLDLSYNLFEDIPAELATYVPLLEELIMDNNPINMIKFGDKLRLSKLSLKNMPMITSIEAFTFTNVGKCYSESCYRATLVKMAGY